MAKRFQEASEVIVLDTSLILPFFGIRVKEISERVITKIELLSKKYTFAYPVVLLPELLGIIVKLFGDEIPPQVKDAMSSLLKEAGIKLLIPTIDATLIALSIRNRGHKDIFDCMLYSMAKAIDATLITLDEELVLFLKRNGFDVSFIKGPNFILKL